MSHSDRPGGEIPAGWLNETAPAKINLCLHVLGRRADGYHLLDGLIAFAEEGDHLRARAASALSLRLEGLFAQGLEATADNLVLRAAAGLAHALGESGGAELTLEKRLPVASGIGGGSADAAATLRLLQRLWGGRLPQDQLDALALALGADVPVCLEGRAAFVSGVGEIIDPAPALPEAWLVLVNPGQGLSTPSVFRARQSGFSAPPQRPSVLPDFASLLDWLKVQSNDLEAPAIRLCPPIREVLAALGAQRGLGLARMSGSGATCFGLFARREEAEAAASTLAKARPEWWSVASRLQG